ncbi:hypothetical protein CB0940_00373 [Cercospora beticola]|uniref:Uncharacterized protein n=1 Tax=Cercospora beticola TaxID=122368 RepID=A0A2G5ICY2_CERBT|nr:hypothetical protein CB0940_00373 [Cercospora beticola]PIB02610.1 hypothetical protein CB0940_00373 [Cercospora beticola]WPA95789.1 hypothetical protein RHO25_000392 [Cercospora beticola]
MPRDRERLFNEARKTRCSGSSDSRRSSTTVDENGCIITRGFVIPSRSSSQSSLARSTTSSFEIPSTPLSPMEPPTPGFARPKPIESALRTSTSAISLSRAVHGVTLSSRPEPERRQTWQSMGSSSASNSRWNDDDLLATTCSSQSGQNFQVPQGPQVVAPARTKTKRSRPPPPKTTTNFRRVRSEQSNLQQLVARESGKERSKSTHVALDRYDKKAHNEPAVKIVAPEQADDAIASDSEDDNIASDGLLRSMTIRRNRLGYATRRAMTDEKNAALMQQVQLAPTPANLYSAIDTPIADASDAGADLVKVSQKLELVSASLADNAIASDSEDDDYTCKGDPKMTAALRQAALHRERNVAIHVSHDGLHDEPALELQKRSMSDAAVAVRLAEPSSNSPHKRNFSTGSATVRLLPPNASVSKSSDVDDLETPIEVKTYDTSSALAMRSLRPSRTRPKPAKGVLKKSGSPPSTGASTTECSPTKKVQTRNRSGSGEVVGGMVRPKSPPRMTADGVFRPGQVTAAEMRRLTEAADIFQ